MCSFIAFCNYYFIIIISLSVVDLLLAYYFYYNERIGDATEETDSSLPL